MDKPKVTIMIPTYNQEEYIAEAIESALAQDYPNLEIIVADDCSTDNTAQISHKYESDARFHYHKNSKNLGRVGNYHNTLYKHASGEWVINLDGDDYYRDSHYISRAMERIISHDNIVCYFAKKYISEKLSSFTNKLIDKDCYLFDGKEFFLNFFEYGGFAHAGALYRRDIALLDKKCYTYPGIQSDFHGIIRYSILGNVIFARDNGYVWRIHNCNATTSINNKNKYKSERYCQQAIIDDLPSGIISEHEKMQWLEAGKKWAKKQYILDCLNLVPSIHTLMIGLANMQISRPYLIVFIKSILRTIGIKLKV